MNASLGMLVTACDGETGPHKKRHEGSGEAYLKYDDCLSFRPRVVSGDDQIGEHRRYLLRSYPHRANSNARNDRREQGSCKHEERRVSFHASAIASLMPDSARV